MSVTPADFYQFAQKIAGAAQFEIDHRNAISRTYYAAYHTCLLRVLQKAEALKPESGHSEFCRQLMSQPQGSALRRVGIALNFLRQHRNGADYALEREFVVSDTNTAFGAYRNVITALDSALPP